MPKMVQLIYASISTRPVRLAELCALLDFAQRKNAACGVTGKLCFDGRVFLQVLEGARRDVNEVYHRITRDERHGDLQIIAVRDIEARSFPGWKMAYSGLTEASKAALARAGVERLDPDALTADTALALLLDLPSMAKPQAA